MKELHEKNIIDLKQVPNDELGRITGKGSDFLEKYFRSESQAIIQKDKIRDELLALKYPICFYDYESISTPIPLLNGVSPYQQAVVQYSLHKLFEDGHIEHFGAVLVEEGETMMRELNEIDDPNLSHQTNRLVVGTQEEFLQLLLDDIGENLLDSSFVVWYKDFENSRNKEIAEVYPSLSDGFLKINDNTYDLFEVFRQYKYFDQKFRGSASIKKVLPVLVPELSYDNLVIGK